MSKINVLIVSMSDSKKGYLDDIAALDSRISVKDGTKQFVAELRSKGREGPLVRRLEEVVAAGTEERLFEVQEDLDSLLAQAEVIFGVLLFPDDLVSRAPRLKWIHIGSTGIDRYLSTGIFDGDITVTNSRGALAIPIAEHVLTFMLMLAKDASRLLSNKQNKLWERFVTMELCGSTVGIVGLGAIGTEVARLAKSIGMNVLATRRSATKRQQNVFGVDELYPRSDLLEMLCESDFVVMATPLTMETKEMIGTRELRAMKPTAYLINVSRGQVVDQTALIKALKEGWIAGAGLDVFETEPLPVDSELWELPNLILTPHMAGSTDKRIQRVLGLFQENLRRYLAGEQLLNVINKQRRY